MAVMSTLNQISSSVTPTETIIFLLGALALHHLVTYLFTQYNNAKFAREHGCLPPPRWKAGILGIPHFLEMVRAAKKKEHVQFITSRWTPGWYTFIQNQFGYDSIQTADPENIKTILATSFKDFELGFTRKDAFHDMLGEGIFTLDGKGWEYSRGLLRPQFSREQVADTEMLKIHVERVLEHMKNAEGTEVDLQPWFYCLTLDSATEFLFGESAESLIKGEEDQKGFAYAFNEGQHWIMWKLRWRKLAKLWNPSEMVRINKNVHGFVDRYVNMALNREKYPLPIEMQKKYVFLDQVAQHQKDPKALRDQMLNILLAGRDTTAGLIGWTFYLLSRHQHIYKKLRDELEEAFGTGEPGVWRLPTFEGLKDVVYLRYVLNEVLRLYPSVPLNGRDCVRNTVLPVGGGPDGLSPVFVHKGMRVQYSVYAMHRRKDIYGEDALEFRPERWGDGSKIGRGWEYLPFNGGPRICLGQQYALTEAGFTIARIMQNYEMMEAVNPFEDPKIEATLTMGPQQCCVRLIPVRK
ncbi:cytochrome P450 [Pyronema domesticum]|uniref:Similar to Cytochrome P450 52A12 acc. no. Q9Y757 n=1 Tax=Pyronema omphalodes (strain CBS 100304) TaxID=1076935 RepID=U4LA29_PYROM|nr:cytochrome P450 [Pyronema domesticum]CCX14453.1 Similar to Cytochrome P450 52A12; acc. no. Q9Y757 [Pyronema omphalodes CBS 100304]